MEAPAVAVAVFVTKDRSVLLGRRLSEIGRGCFALPGGRLEFGESFEDCATREVKEETGLDICHVEVLHVANFVERAGPTPVHFVTLFVRAKLVDPAQEPENLEPGKCGGWAWFEWPVGLPSPLFRSLDAVVRAGLDPFGPLRLFVSADERNDVVV